MALRTIAVLSPGEMGSQVATVLRESGARVVTCLEGRGPGSAQRAEAAGMEALPSLGELARQAELILAVVPSAAAEPLAGRVAEALRRTGCQPLYVDANSIAPSTALRIQQAIREAGGAFVDGAIIGGASDLRGRTRFYLAGERAEEAAALLEPPLNVSVLGREAGQASAFKVLYAGLTKGMSALGVELFTGAERLGLSEALLDKYRADHPSVAQFLERNLPGLPARARRRAQEMDELTDTLEQHGLSAHMAQAAKATLEEVDGRFRDGGGPEREDWEAVVAWLGGRRQEARSS